jgi:non-homologous end joining protein Ku
MHTLWTGTLEFGLVYIPFKIGSASFSPGADSPALAKGNIIRIEDFLLKDEVHLPSPSSDTTFQIQPEDSGLHAFDIFRHGLIRNNKVAFGIFNALDNNRVCWLHATDTTVWFHLGDEVRDTEQLNRYINFRKRIKQKQLPKRTFNFNSRVRQLLSGQIRLF